jgi:drug/metabolite transporter (DMT)-like permease
MSHETARLRWKTWICAVVVVLSNVFGNFFMKRGIPGPLESPLDYITVLFRPYVALGVALMILWTLSRMAFLSWADLSYVLPVTAIGYALVAIVGRVLLDEQISAKRWAGILIIMAGVALVGGGAPQTVTREAKKR